MMPIGDIGIDLTIHVKVTELCMCQLTTAVWLLLSSVCRCCSVCSCMYAQHSLKVIKVHCVCAAFLLNLLVVLADSCWLSVAAGEGCVIPHEAAKHCTPSLDSSKC